MIPEDKILISEFVASRDLADKTKQEYFYALSLFADHMETRGGILCAVPDDFEAWAARLSESTYGSYLSALRSFFKWGSVEGHCPPSAIMLMRNKGKAPRWKRTRLTDDEAQAAVSSLEKARDAAICSLVLQCGLTASQVARLDMGSLSEGRGGLTLLCPPRKGVGADYVIEVWAPAAAVVSRHRRDRVEQGAQGPDPLFTSLSPRNHGCRLTQRSVIRIVSDGLSAIGLTSRDVEAKFGSRGPGGMRRCVVPCPSCAALNGRCPLA